MSKFLKIMIALVVIAAMAAPAFAEDRLKLAGSYDIYGFYTNNVDGDDAVNDESANFDQRFRLGGSIAVAEGVAIKFRMDLEEGNFGDGTSTGDPLYIDDMYIQFETEMATIKAGQHYLSLGKGIAFEDRSSAFSVTTKTAVPVMLGYHKEIDNTLASAGDQEVYVAQASHKTDMYSGSIFAAYENAANTAADDNQYLIGVSADFNAGPAFITGELDYFGGDAGTGVDAVGLQLYLDGSMALNDMVKVGAMFLYATGNDKADETQITHISDRNAGWAPQEYGPNSTDFGFISNIFDYVGDIAGAPSDCGIIGGGIYADVKVSDDLALSGNFLYATPAEDAQLGTVDANTYFLTAGSSYKLFANTTLNSSIHYMKVAEADDAALGAITYMSVKF